MLTHKHNHNGGGYAAAASLRAPRRVRGPHLQPQGSLTRSLTRRPTAALEPRSLDGPQPAHRAGRPTPAPLARGANKPTQLQDRTNRSLHGPRGLPP
jgi:hypothetical protein